MNIFSTNKLIYDLAHSELTATQKMYYLLAGQVLYTFFTYQSLYAYHAIDVFFIVEFLVVLVVVFFGVMKCYEANGGNSGEKFIEYFVCLSVPVSIKIGFFIWGVFIVYHLVGHYIFDMLLFIDPRLIHELIVLTISVLGQCLFFWRMFLHLSKINHIKNEGMTR